MDRVNELLREHAALPFPTRPREPILKDGVKRRFAARIDLSERLPVPVVEKTEPSPREKFGGLSHQETP